MLLRYARFMECFERLVALPSVFFFKQKTAYELRISDWSSDVCSSDLAADQHNVIAQSPTVRRQVVDRQKQRQEQEQEYIRREEIGGASWRERVCQYV